jgi:hypothetical protein
MRRPYTLYKETLKIGTFWYARFWDESLKKYAHSRSTGIPVEGKRERRWEAEKTAEALCAEFANPQTKEPPSSSAVPIISSKPLTSKAALPAPTVADMPLIQYLEEFWTENSEYARIAGRNTLRRKKDGTVFENKIMSGRRANSVLQSMRVAIRWAVDNEDLAIDPFRRLGEVAENLREKGVLTLEERNTLIAAPISDPRCRLAVLLGCRGPSVRLQYAARGSPGPAMGRH